MVNPVTYIEITLNQTKLFSVYHGLIQGQGGYNPSFFGLFQTLKDAKKELNKVGLFIEEFDLREDQKVMKLGQTYLDKFLKARGFKL